MPGPQHTGEGANGAAAMPGRRTWGQRMEDLRAAVPALLLGGAAAALAWWLALELIGEEAAVFAPVAAVLTLGLSSAEHNRRAIGVALGVAVGLTIAGALVDVIGDGVWQLGVVIVLARAGAILADGSVLAVNQATITAVLVVTLHEEDVFPGDRFVDAAIGCFVALGAAALMGWMRSRGWLGLGPEREGREA